jgi:hypothetical protein
MNTDGHTVPPIACALLARPDARDRPWRPKAGLRFVRFVLPSKV